MLAFGITQTRNAKPVFGSGSARIDKAPLGAFKRKRSCLAVSVGVMCLAVVSRHKSDVKPIQDRAQWQND